jgi:hypothetical protein
MTTVDSGRDDNMGCAQDDSSFQDENCRLLPWQYFSGGSGAKLAVLAVTD